MKVDVANINDAVGKKLVMGFAVGTMGAQALTCHVVDVSERWRMQASRVSEGWRVTCRLNDLYTSFQISRKCCEP